jgi:phosphatidylglycerophosphate synthase
MLDKIANKYPNLRKKLVGRFVFKTNPNYISFLALIIAIIAGLLFYYGHIYLGALFVLLNGFFDILDGQIAKTYGTSKRGDFLDHTFDRLADIAIILGITLTPIIPDLIGFSTIIAVLLVSYLGTASQAVSENRIYGGGLGRSDRLIILFIAPLLTYFWTEALLYSIYLILVLSIVTFFVRFYRIYANI